MRPLSKRGRKNESDYGKEDDDLFAKNVSDSFDPVIINVTEKKGSPKANKKKL